MELVITIDLKALGFTEEEVELWCGDFGYITEFNDNISIDESGARPGHVFCWRWDDGGEVNADLDRIGEAYKLKFLPDATEAQKMEIIIREELLLIREENI